MAATLRQVADGVAVVACNTCRLSDEAREDPAGRRGGARLVEALHAAHAADRAYAAIAVQEMPCLFACQDHCTVHLRAPGKVGYILGRFSPDAEAARAILDFTCAYAESEMGQVPYKQWPQGVRGHFITRMPPAGFVVVE